MMVKRYIPIILCIVLLLSMTGSSYAQIDGSSQDGPQRVLVYECYNYRILETGALDPRMMTDDELRSFDFPFVHSKDFGGYYFEYIPEEESRGSGTEMSNTRVFVLYLDGMPFGNPVGDQITVLTRHTFGDSEEITADVVLSDVYGEAKQKRDDAYEKFKEMLGCKLMNPRKVEAQVPLIYTMIKYTTEEEYSSSSKTLERTCLRKGMEELGKKLDLVEASNNKGRVILWREPSSSGEVLYIVNAYPPGDKHVGGFEPDNTFLAKYVFVVRDEWGRRTSTDIQGYSQIIENNIFSIDQDPVARYSGIPFLCARQSNYRMMRYVGNEVYFGNPMFSRIVWVKEEIEFEISSQNLEDDKENDVKFQEMLLLHLDYIYERMKQDHAFLKERQVKLEDEIDGFDSYYLLLAAGLGVLIFLHKLFQWAFKENRKMNEIFLISRLSQYAPSIKNAAFIGAVSVLIYDAYVSICIMRQTPERVKVGVPELPYNPQWFYVILLTITITLVIMYKYRNSNGKKNKKTTKKGENAEKGQERTGNPINYGTEDSI